jgi:hypothetical protein
MKYCIVPRTDGSLYRGFPIKQLKQKKFLKYMGYQPLTVRWGDPLPRPGEVILRLLDSGFIIQADPAIEL